MPLAPGVRLGPYEVSTLLGAGGMGEVYRARDTRLGRSVALKVLHLHVAQDPRLRERFEREAKAVSSLNHPHICVLYDVGRHDEQEFLVMELVEGETLAARLRKGPLPLELAIRYAIQIAEGLDHAHRQGITHRDLKPANVILSRQGAKLLDFGLAKLRDPAADANKTLDGSVARLEALGSRAVSSLATADGPLTEAGVVLGTFDYMAPEQLEGYEADERTDIFAFGAVLYELITGRKAFDASTRAGLIGAVLMGEPTPAREHQPAVPPLLDRIVRRCLAKDPHERWQSVRDLLVALRWVAEGEAAIQVPHKETARRTRLAVAVALLAVLGLGLTVWNVFGTRQPSSPVLSRGEVAIPTGQSLATELFPSLSVSPDGTHIVFRVESGTTSQLYVKESDQLEPRPLQGTDGGHSPFFSPDGTWVGFLANSKIYRVPIAGGPPLLIANAPMLSAGSPGVTWGPDDTIVFAAGISGLMRVRVSDAGGTPELLTTPRKGTEVAHFGPQSLPGREELLFTVRTAEDQWRVAVLSLRTRQWDWLPPLPPIGNVAGARYVGTGHLVYAQNGSLFAIPLDLARRVFTGSPIPLPEPVYTRVVADAIVAQFVVSDTGRFVYAAGDPPEWTLVSVTRDGEARPMGALPPHLYRYPRYSRDGRVAVTIEEQRGDIYIVDPTLGTLRKLTTTGSNTQAIWTVDNERVLFASRRVGSNHYDIYWMPSDGSAVAEALITRDGGQFPTSWAPGGDLLALYELGNTSARDILVWSMRDKRIAQVLDTPANERSPTFSPDGRLLAYVSDAAGQDDVYVMRYPGPGGGEVVSSGGGTDPVWSPLSSPNRYELFYRRNDRIVAVTIRTEPRIAADPPRELFDGPYVSLPAGTGGRPNYDVAPDGRSFVMVRRADRSAMHLHVTENWFEQLRPRSAD